MSRSAASGIWERLLSDWCRLPGQLGDSWPEFLDWMRGATADTSFPAWLKGLLAEPGSPSLERSASPAPRASAFAEIRKRVDRIEVTQFEGIEILHDSVAKGPYLDVVLTADPPIATRFELFLTVRSPSHNSHRPIDLGFPFHRAKEQVPVRPPATDLLWTQVFPDCDRLIVLPRTVRVSV